MRDLLRYILMRLATAVPTLLVGVTLIFLVINLVPGDPALIYLGEYYTPEAHAALVKEMGLDRPLHVRYFDYLGNLLRGDLGRSFRTGREIWADIRSHFPYTLMLAVTAIILAALIGIPAGIIAGSHRNRAPDQIIMLGTLAAVSIPGFWFGILLMMVFAVNLRLLPTIGAGNIREPLSMLPYLVLPALAIGSRSAAMIARLSRASLLDCLQQDYVRTARAKGLREQVVLYQHAFRNALLPVITSIALNLGHLLGGAVVVEKVFCRPGLGQLLVDGVLCRDYPQVQGTMVFFIVMVLCANLLADIAYALADPRVAVE